MDPNIRKSWEELLNPNVTRPRLIAASIYIAGFEALRDAVVARIRYFFWNGFDETGDKIDPKYQSDVLTRNRSPVYASLDWLKEMNAIDDADIEAFNRVKTCRNRLAHELLTTLGWTGLPLNSSSASRRWSSASEVRTLVGCQCRDPHKPGLRWG